MNSQKDLSYSKYDRHQHTNEFIKKYEIRRQLNDIKQYEHRKEREKIMGFESNKIINDEESNKIIDLDPKAFDTPRFDTIYRYPAGCGCHWKNSKWYSRHHKTIHKKGSNKDKKNWRSSARGNPYCNPSSYYLRHHISQELNIYYNKQTYI